MKKSKFSRGIVLSVLVMVAALLPVIPSQAAPTVKLLNPSTYSGANLRISAKEDANGDTSYHLVAWSGEVPANPLVEFEIAATPGIPGSGGNEPTLATVTATRVGTDTFEGSLSTATVPDGQYFLRAILYGGFLGPGTGSEVARDEQPVMLQSTQAAALNTVEMAYPTNGGPLGFSKTGNRPGIAVFNGFVSDGTNSVRALFTTSAPGTAPEWSQTCGTAGVQADNSFLVRCTLGEAVNPTSVRAVAVVANRTPPPAPAQQGGDETGDAHRVIPYLQNPTTVTFEPPSKTSDQGACTLIGAVVKDQSGIPVAGLNIDFHAQGPDDQLRFATQNVNGVPTHGGFQPPDAAHSGTESTAQCQRTDPENRQGDHNVPGAPDVKHIESLPNGGTGNVGQFSVIMISGTRGGTQMTAWGDENDDDNLNSGEASGSAQIGWGQAPPPAAVTLSLDPSSASASVGDCERFVVTATQNGTAQSGRNVDVHIVDPTGVQFCNPGDSNVSPPDAGGHTGDSHPGQENSHHAEGATNGSGQLIFGVTSSSAGDTSVSVWLDENDSDTQDGTETATAGTIEWFREGGRDVSIQASKRSVRKGSQVTLSGRISGSDTCAGDQRVKIQSSRRKSGRFRTIATVTTQGSGSYDVRVRVNKTKHYRALAPRKGPCGKATSNTVKVRAR